MQFGQLMEYNEIIEDLIEYCSSKIMQKMREGD